MLVSLEGLSVLVGQGVEVRRPLFCLSDRGWGYVPNLQVGGQVVSFHDRASGTPIPSLAIMERIGTTFRAPR